MNAPKNARAAALEALIDAHASRAQAHNRPPPIPSAGRRSGLRSKRVAYRAALLETEMAESAERRENRRLIGARFLALNRLEDFRFAHNSKVAQATSRRWPGARGSMIAPA